MDLRPITQKQKNQYNKVVTHVVQSWEWGEFRQQFSPILRFGLYQNNRLKIAFTLTLHKIPFSSQAVGYLPKGPLPDKQLGQALTKIGQDYNCAFIKVEPNVQIDQVSHYSLDPIFSPSLSAHYLKHNYVIDLTQSDEQLFKNMYPKTRYNIKLAQKKGVVVEERIDKQGFEIFLKLHLATTKRQNFFSHNEDYHRKVWQTLSQAGMARVLIGYYEQKPLSAWMLYNFKDTLYYPYGGSSSQHREVMANNIVVWEAIKLGQKLDLKKFDLWGALGPDADSNDPWQGFTRFKAGYGGKMVEYMGSYDLVFNDPLYWMFTVVDKLLPLKVFLLKLIGK